MTKFFLILLAVGFISSLCLGQANTMLINEIDGNRYKKSNYNANGQLESYQILTVGSIEPNGKTYKLPVEIIDYQKSGTSQDTTKTLYTCDPDDQKIFVNIFLLFLYTGQ